MRYTPQGDRFAPIGSTDQPPTAPNTNPINKLQNDQNTLLNAHQRPLATTNNPPNDDQTPLRIHLHASPMSAPLPPDMRCSHIHRVASDHTRVAALTFDELVFVSLTDELVHCALL